MKKVTPSLLSLIIALSATQARAEGEVAYALSQKDLSTYFKEEADFYMWKVNKNAPEQGQLQCSSTYSNILSKGTMDITYVMGYLDTAGEKASTMGADGTNYGVARSTDEAISNAILTKLTEPCKKPSQKVCEFAVVSKDASVTKLSKNIEMLGRAVTVNITLAYSSASEIYENNKSTLKDQQLQYTQLAESLFLNGVKTADIAFYNGHSRNGGGPDFAPPILRRDNHTDYSQYLKNRPGITKVMNALRERGDNNLILGLFSCSSNPHFSKRLLSVNSQQKLILSGDTIYTNESMIGSLGYLESIMRGLCGTELTQAARQSDRTMYGFSEYNMN